MKHSDLSLKATRLVVWTLFGIFAVVLVTAPWLFRWYCGLGRTFSTARYTALLATFYACSPAAAITLFHLNKFLRLVEQDKGFTREAVKSLRILSWTCFAAGLLAIPLCFFVYGAFPIPAAGLFLWLLLRVVKNSFEKATDLQEENDLTV